MAGLVPARLLAELPWGFAYAPWAFVNYLIPVIALIYAWTNTFILRLPEGAAPQEADATSETP